MGQQWGKQSNGGLIWYDVSNTKPPKIKLYFIIIYSAFKIRITTQSALSL